MSFELPSSSGSQENLQNQIPTSPAHDGKCARDSRNTNTPCIDRKGILAFQRYRITSSVKPSELGLVHKLTCQSEKPGSVAESCFSAPSGPSLRSSYRLLRSP